MEPNFEMVVDGIDFGEGPRWHDGKFWYSDFYQHSVFTVSESGERTAVHTDIEDRPSGLGWLADGSLLVVAMTSRRVLREVDGELVEHADLSAVATGNCNDMVVDSQGNAYVGNFGFDLEHGSEFAAANMALVRPDGSVEVAAELLAFPNGSVITPDGSTLIVGQTFGAGYVAFSIGDDGTLSDRRSWAEIPGTGPDGCTLDAEGGIWMSDAFGGPLLRVLEGGEITHRWDPPMTSYACTLGGSEGTTLYVLCAPGSSPADVDGKGAGALYAIDVDIPHAGLP